MPAREYECKVLGLVWQTPTVLSVRFEPSRRFDFEPGQFLSVFVPRVPGALGDGGKDLRRIYSLASGGKREVYELCVQLLPNGKASTYLASLKPGDRFRVAAPYGDFFLRTEPSRNVCFIATGTGIAPFKSMILSQKFKKHPPAAAVLIFGARSEKDILFPGLFEQHGVEVVHALSRSGPEWKGFRGRVTDFLQALPEDWAWQDTDFYLCGNGFMVQDVQRHLSAVRHVSACAIRLEAYFSTEHLRVEEEALEQAA